MPLGEIIHYTYIYIFFFLNILFGKLWVYVPQISTLQLITYIYIYIYMYIFLNILFEKLCVYVPQISTVQLITYIRFSFYSRKIMKPLWHLSNSRLPWPLVSFCRRRYKWMCPSQEEKSSPPARNQWVGRTEWVASVGCTQVYWEGSNTAAF